MNEEICGHIRILENKIKITIQYTEYGGRNNGSTFN